MAIALYPTAEIAWARILERGWAIAIDEPYAAELLVISAGVDVDAVTHFRAWFVGAKMIEQNLTTQALTEADGAKFTRLQPVIDSLLKQQRQYDESNALIIPLGFEALPSDCDRCDDAQSLGGGSPAFQPRKPRTIQTIRR